MLDDITFGWWWTGTNSQSSTSKALTWIQCKLGKQYLVKKFTLPWESNPGPFSNPGRCGNPSSVCWVKKTCGHSPLNPSKVGPPWLVAKVEGRHDPQPLGKPRTSRTYPLKGRHSPDKNRPGVKVGQGAGTLTLRHAILPPPDTRRH